MLFDNRDMAPGWFVVTIKPDIDKAMNEQIKINWYRTKVDRQLMSALMKRSDFKALRQSLLQLGLFALTATLSYLAFRHITAANWYVSVPLLFFCLFLHGTFSQFMGLVAVHELCHKTPFRTQWLNDFFMYLFSFLSWSDPITFRVSHVKHHQVTVHKDHDGEVILPAIFDAAALKFWVWAFAPLPKPDFDTTALKFWFWAFAPLPKPEMIWGILKRWTKYARGDLRGECLFSGGEEWMQKVLPENNLQLRLRHRNWGRVVLLGHLALATLFIVTGHWFLIVLINMPTFYSGWLGMLSGTPQHIGLMPDTPDFRLCCRSYTCGPFIGFLYWNMQYHVEHHMFPAVPFYNLPALRKVIQHDLPPAPHGLLATWRELLPILKKQREDPDYTFIPELPKAA